MLSDAYSLTFKFKNITNEKSFIATNVDLRAIMRRPYDIEAFGSMNVKKVEDAIAALNHLNLNSKKDLCDKNGKIEVYRIFSDKHEEIVAELYNVKIIHLNYDTNFCKISWEWQKFFKDYLIDSKVYIKN